MKNNDTEHSMTVNFIFYPGVKNELEERIRLLLQESVSSKKSDSTTDTTAAPVKAIISPHAGWVHCDKIMASAFTSVAKRDIETVVILSRVHREPAKAVFLPQFTSYATPLGELQVDQSVLTELVENNRIFKFDNIPHVEEHSIEVQLPFIKYLWPSAKIVPILTGKSSASLADKLAVSLSEILKGKLEKALFVISSSSSSYDTEEKTREETDRFITLLNSSDQWETMPDMLDKGKIGACSADCLYAVLKIQKENVFIEMLKMEYGQTSDPKEKRVCFGAFSLTGGEK